MQIANMKPRRAARRLQRASGGESSGKGDAADMILHPAFSTLPTAMTLSTSGASAPSGFCPSLVLSGIPAASGIVTLGGQNPSTAGLQPCLIPALVGPATAASSLLPVFTPQVSRFSTASAAGDLSCQVTASSVPASQSAESGKTASVGESSASNSDTPVGLDLGNGWRVVGLTSLMDSLPPPPPPPPHTAFAAGASGGVAVYTATPAFAPTANSSNAQMYCPDTSTNASANNQDSSKTASTKDCEEWKIVGVTSLKDIAPENVTQSYFPVPTSTKASETGEATSAASAVTVTSPGLHPVCLIGSVNSPASAVLTKNVTVSSSSPSLPTSLEPQKTDLDTAVANSLGCSGFGLKGGDWKIAGITTLPIPPLSVANVPAVNTEQSSSAVGSGGVGTGMIAGQTDDTQWRVVGVTSLPSGEAGCVPQSNRTAGYLPSSAAATGVNETRQITSVPQASDQPSLVVPFVPLQVPVSSVPSASSVPVVPEATGLVGDAGWKVVGVVPLPQGGDASVCKHSSEAPTTEETSVKPTDNQTSVQPTAPEGPAQTITPQRKENKKSHPLSFLPNCSNQFRNAILKKNTVSTMLELKRAYQQKQRREGKLLVAAPSSLNLPIGHPELMIYRGHPEDKGSVCHSEDTDDKIALSKHYNAQMMADIHSSGFDPSTPETTSSHSGRSGLRSRRVKQEVNIQMRETNEPLLVPKYERRGDEKHTPQEGWCVYSADKGELILSDSGSSSDGVNLMSVDPWGVCTDDDADDVADMMADKSEKRTVHSSSRKRKLSTPRKMVQ